MKTSTLYRQQKVSTSVPAAGAANLLSPLSVGIVAVALAVAVLAIYSPTLNFKFILDDHRYVGDPRVQSPGHVWEYFTTYVWAQFTGGPASFYRPLFVLWMRLNFIFSGESPWGWHLLSVLKHVSVAVLLGLLVWKLLRDRVAALLAGALFALHPAQAESVAWISVPDSLMSVAILGSLLLYLQYIQREAPTGRTQTARSHRKSRKQVKGQTRPSAIWLYASAAACLAAMMAKETAIVLPAIFFAVALVAPADSRRAAAPAEHAIQVRMVSALRETLPFLVATVVYLLLRRNALGGQISPLTQHLPWSTVLLSWPATLLVLSEGAALACALLRVRGPHPGQTWFRCGVSSCRDWRSVSRQPPSSAHQPGPGDGPGAVSPIGSRPESSARCCWEPYSWYSRSF